jgi:hypothetical protein
MDAGFEPYRWVYGVSLAMIHKPRLSTIVLVQKLLVLITDMYPELLSDTRREPIRGGSTPASMREMVSGSNSGSTSRCVSFITVFYCY